MAKTIQHPMYVKHTNVPVVDEGHDKLISIRNHIKSLSVNNACKNDLAGIFFALSNFYENHLIKEELFLKSKGYKNLDNHKNSHLDFIKGIERLKDNYEKDIASTLNELDDFIGAWLENHSSIFCKEGINFLSHE